MKKIEWSKRNILKALFWGVFVLLIVIAVFVFRQEGLWAESMFSGEFYKLDSQTVEQRVFHGKDSVITQTGFFPDAQEVYIEVKSGDDAVLWTLTRGDNQKMTISNEDISYEGSYQISAYDATFYFDDWDKYWDDWTVSYEGTDAVVSRYGSQELFGSFVRMAYGHTDSYGKHSMEILIPWLLLMIMAYVIGFHAEQLFELRKAFEFDYRNAESLEPSEWYFISSYIGAGAILAISLFIYLHMIGLIGFIG